MPRRVDRVRIQLRHVVIEMPWAVSRQLVGRLAAAGVNGERVADQFRAVGVSRPVVIDRPEEEVLLAVLERWVAEEGVWDEADHSIRQLLDILRPGGAGQRTS